MNGQFSAARVAARTTLISELARPRSQRCLQAQQLRQPTASDAHPGTSALLEACALSPARAASERPSDILPPGACRSRDRGDREARSHLLLRTRRSILPLRSAFVTHGLGPNSGATSFFKRRHSSARLLAPVSCRGRLLQEFAVSLGVARKTGF